MLPIAIFLSQGQALVAQSSLRAAGIPCHLGSWHQVSVQPITVALGGMRLWVPVTAMAEAAAALEPMDAEAALGTLLAWRRRVWRLLGAYVSAILAMAAFIAAYVGMISALPIGAMISVLATLSISLPPPPWRGDYFIYYKSDT
jgi:hypothetical protein